MKLGGRFEHLENGLPAPGPAFLCKIFKGQPDYVAIVLDTKFQMFFWIRSRNMKGSHNVEK